MKLTYYGQSCFAVEVSKKNILFDPFIKRNPLASHINVDEIKADYIFLSQGHCDHVTDLIDIDIAKRTGATCVGAAEVDIKLIN